MVNFRSINRAHIKQILSSYQDFTSSFTVRRPFDSFLRRYFYEHRDLGGSERAVISHGAFDLLRHHSLLSFLTRDSKAEWESRVRVLESDDAIQKALADKTIPMYTPYLLLKTPKAHQGKLPAVVSTQVAHCHSLFDLLAKRHGNDKAFGFMLASNEKPPLTIRVNALKATREEFLRSSELHCRRTEISPVGLQLVTRHQVSLSTTPSFRQGLFEVQDEASQLCALRVECQPKEKVLDFCAGSGGKTLAYAPRMQNQGVIHIHDRNPKSLEKARVRFKRAGVQNYMMFEPHSKMQFDWVVLDVPCTGLGTMRRNPDLKLFLTRERLDELVQLQRNIFDEAVARLKRDGKLVYITCSYLAEENEEQVKHFCQRYSMRVKDESYFQSLPVTGGMDAFFSATLEFKK